MAPKTPPQNPSCSVCVISHNAARLFMRNESKRINALPESDARDTHYLSIDDYLFELTTFYGIFNNLQMVGLGVVPIYDSRVMMRLYVAPEYRSKGLGAHVINYLKITSLGCLRKNKRALELYKLLGFTEIPGYSDSICSLYRKI
jgi:GNAT superfamily N-acetyltransferase